jgi:hypothetical protein
VAISESSQAFRYTQIWNETALLSKYGTKSPTNYIRYKETKQVRFLFFRLWIKPSGLFPYRINHKLSYGQLDINPCLERDSNPHPNFEGAKMFCSLGHTTTMIDRN